MFNSYVKLPEGMGIHGKCSFQRPVYGGWLSFIINDEDLLDSCHQLFGYPIFQTTLGSRSESPGEFHKDPSYDRDLYGNETFNNQVTMWTGIRWAKRTGFVWKIWGKHHTPLPFCLFLLPEGDTNARLVGGFMVQQKWSLPGMMIPVMTVMFLGFEITQQMIFIQ